MVDDELISQPSTTIDNTSTVIPSILFDENENRQMMMQDMEGTSGIPKTTIRHILTE